jgi:hypothetical protein
MPNYAHLEIELHCPDCTTLITDIVWFQWAFCPGHTLHKDLVYHVGDAVRWKQCSHGGLFSWASFRDDERNAGTNIGDPTIRNLICSDVYQFYWDSLEQRRRCPTCRAILEGAMVEIRDGTIRGARIYRPGEFAQRVDVYLIGQDGQYFPKPEWYDHQVASVDDCGTSEILPYRSPFFGQNERGDAQA